MSNLKTYTKTYPKWLSKAGRIAADRMDDCQYSLCQAREAWEKAGKPDTAEHRQASQELQEALEQAQRVHSVIARQDMAKFFAAINV